MRKLALAMSVAAVACVTAAVPAVAGAKVTVKFQRIAGVKSPGTPAKYNRVGILKTGSPKAKNILVLNPGTSASAAYFEPLAKDIVTRAKGWQVWAVERRENLLEDQSMLDKAKEGKATGQQLFDYYLGYITNSSIKTHFQSIPDSSVGFARDWGMNTEIGDLRRVVLAAEKLGGHVVVGGHSLGGSIVTAYATWDFNGKPGAKGLSGLVYDDGASSPTPVTADQANQSLQKLQAGSPWLAFGGIVAPFAGLFQATGSTGALIDPNGPSLGQAFPLLPANLKPPVPVTNLAEFGYALDTKTSPPSLAAAQAHLGQLAASGDPRGWDGKGALTPIKRFAQMFSGTGLKGLDGTAWYHPMRLTIDAGAVAQGNANPAQQVLDVHATEGHKLPRNLKIYAFGAALGGPRVPAAAEQLAKQSHIPHRNLVLVNRQSTYAHNDPAGASPKHNLFLKKLLPFLRGIARG
jgi:pimeloyl-ACP methyl ester carboxylesterase